MTVSGNFVRQDLRDLTQVHAPLVAVQDSPLEDATSRLTVPRSSSCRRVCGGLKAWSAYPDASFHGCLC